MTDIQTIAALGSGALIGLVLGLVGGGGSILAAPLLIYVVGVPSVHAAIGTASLAVTVNALTSLAGHARSGMVKWRCASVFAIAGVMGAALGAEVGKAFDGKQLLMLFGLLMIGVGMSMLRRRRQDEAPDVRLTLASASVLLPRLGLTGLAVGSAAGFFGIGGGFLIVPGLMAATAMPLRNAVGTSLVVVTALGMTTAASYALSGYVDWPLSGLLIAGGVGGAVAGIGSGHRLARNKGLLERLFAVIVIGTGAYIAARGS
ncbi:sulfite exporter TauE/SafE family protein [Sphingobium sp. ZW T5_29]|uniref:sulfite exporter TauE/SafE family protein n=1 Tax=Sphingobium sp. ZW T5_29 TaxID=3378077 RepID=UPI00385496EA